MTPDEPKSLAEVLKERRSQHGDFTDHARVSQSLKSIMWAERSWGALSPTQQEGLEMIQHKIARILAGNADHDDHWRDIAGYATITADRLNKKEEPNYSGTGKKVSDAPEGFHHNPLTDEFEEDKLGV